MPSTDCRTWVENFLGQAAERATAGAAKGTCKSGMTAPAVRRYGSLNERRANVAALADDPQHAFPGQGQMKPEQLEIAQLKREVIKLKAERDILKKAAAYFAKEST